MAGITMPASIFSIQQPWAWLIIHGGKDVELRSRVSHFEGRFLIHTGAEIKPGRYDRGAELYGRIRRRGQPELPARRDLERGGIIGAVTMVDCVTESDSPWFFDGYFGYVLKDPKPLRFQPMKGQLNFFQRDTPELRQLLSEAGELD